MKSRSIVAWHEEVCETRRGLSGGTAAQRTLRSRSIVWSVAEFMAARFAWPRALAAKALLALPIPKSENPLAADSLVKLPLAVTAPRMRPPVGFTILRSIATDPVRRATVFSRVGLATATPAPVESISIPWGEATDKPYGRSPEEPKAVAAEKVR